jgi:spore germination cell wall hydrolase CwlJ-like protein
MTPALCLALAIYFEAGTESPTGKAAVGFSVVNSAREQHLSICKEVFGGHYIGVTKHEATHPNGRNWRSSQAIASQILARRIQDFTQGATNFECTKWRTCANPPWWSKGMEYKGIYGSQKFWKRLH